MDWPTVIFILGILAIVSIVIIGGKAKVSKTGVEVDTPGFLDWLQKAKAAKGAANLPPEAITAATPINPKPVQPGVKLPRAAILWIDDNPLNNINERFAFASVGVFCD